ncbi:SGNH/GDSL hydrolase family protein [Streptomyces sp. NBC_01304]|uniref:SGNH/GDSL hydrolase family protein n=1 Tax=Streptomyces sp. NBC_01304 TaxID=2903818 RepID=UPI002E12F6C4|nr:SGNH/GDSL hydrolase family protein [Streptomyces sp. NBC_01304]
MTVRQRQFARPLGVLVVLALLAAGVLAWRLMVDSDPSGAAAAPPPDTTRSTAPGTKEPQPKPGRPDRTSEPRTPAARAVYLGDSLAMENQEVLAGLLEKSGSANLRSAPHSGTTLCDYLEGDRERSLVPPEHKAAALVREERPKVVVLQFWGNSWGYTPCMGKVGSGTPAYYERYAADARALTGQIERAAHDAGIPRPRIVWVLQGPDAMAPDRIRQVNQIYEAQAKAASDLTADAGARVTRAGDRYRYVQRLPCTAYEQAHPAYCTGQGSTDLHRDDDYLHFCLAPTTTTPKPCRTRSPGILRYSQAIASAVEKYLKK